MFIFLVQQTENLLAKNISLFPMPRINRMSPIERRRLPSGGMDEEDEHYFVDDEDNDDLDDLLMSPTLSATRRYRRGGQPRQLSIESYYSFASEGDGDIFASAEHLIGPRRQRIGLHRQASFCLPDATGNISDYSEFNAEDLNSSISELFARGSGANSRLRGRLGTQGTFSEQGSIRSLSIDQEDITYEVPGMRSEEQQLLATAPEGGDDDGSNGAAEGPLVPPPPSYGLAVGGSCGGAGCGGIFQEYLLDELPFDNDGDDVVDGYMSSSCSISMSSEPESSHQITVPVFIEPAPPEIRFLFEDEDGENGAEAAANAAQADSDGAGGAEHDLGGLLLLRGGGGSYHPPSASRLVHQETMHTDSGLDTTEDICPASPTNSRYNSSFRSESPMPPTSGKRALMGSSHLAAGEDVEEEEEQQLRLVLVRDIGIQCCAAESPNLSGNRRRQRSAESATGTDKYPPELLF